MKIENVFYILNQKIKFKFNNTISFLKLKIEILIKINKTKIQNKTVNQNRKTKLINSFKQTNILGRFYLFILLIEIVINAIINNSLNSVIKSDKSSYEQLSDSSHFIILSEQLFFWKI